MKRDEFRTDYAVSDGNQKMVIPAGGDEVTIMTGAFSLVKLYFPPNWTLCDVNVLESDNGVDWYNTKIETGVGAQDLISVNVAPNDCRSYGYFLIGAPFVKLVCSQVQVNSVTVKAVLSPLMGRL